MYSMFAVVLTYPKSPFNAVDVVSSLGDKLSPRIYENKSPSTIKVSIHKLFLHLSATASFEAMNQVRMNRIFSFRGQSAIKTLFGFILQVFKLVSPGFRDKVSMTVNKTINVRHAYHQIWKLCVESGSEVCLTLEDDARLRNYSETDLIRALQVFGDESIGGYGNFELSQSYSARELGLSKVIDHSKVGWFGRHHYLSCTVTNTACASAYSAEAIKTLLRKSLESSNSWGLLVPIDVFVCRCLNQADLRTVFPGSPPFAHLSNFRGLRP